MTRSIVICEKPSQAENIRAAIGSDHGEVLPAQGHLYTLADPESYRDEWKLWQGFHLLRPSAFKKVPTKGETPERTAQLDRRRKAIAAAIKGAQRVVIATDCDREGQVIGSEIVEALGFKGEVLRAMFNSEDADTLREAFAALKPNDAYRQLYEAGLARERADQVYNLSLTRAASVALIPKGVSATLGVGRVRTPTLGIVCIREIAIAQFKPSTSYGIAATVKAGEREIVLSYHPDAPAVTDRAQGEAAVAAAIGQTGQLAVTTTRKKKAGPKPPDMSTLQEIAGRWGWTATKVMETAQAIYDRHITTYPRAETRFLPEALIPAATEITAALASFGPWRDAAPASPTIRKGKQGVFSDAGLGGESHHAIIPNPKALATLPAVYDALGPDERRLFDVIARLFLQSVSPDYEYDETAVSLAIGDATYGTKGTVPIVAGWRALRDAPQPGQDAEVDEAGEIPALENGADAVIVAAQLAERTTRAPERFNEGTLVKAMKNAAQFIRDPALRERLKDAKGIGTQATRDTVISGLKDQGLLMTKAGKLYPTQAGMAVFTIFHKTAPTLVDPGTTAVWESRIDEILAGGISVDTFVDEVAAETQRLIDIFRQAEPTTAFGTPTPTEKQIALAETIARKTRDPLPAAYKTDAAACKAYLDAHARPAT